VVFLSGPGFVLTAAVTLVTGTMFLMWLGEQITERGIGNGISILIFAGIVAGLPAAIGGTCEETAGPPHVRSSVQSFASEIEYGRRYTAYLRVEYHSVSSHHWRCCDQQHQFLAEHVGLNAAAWATGLHPVVRICHYFLLFFLYHIDGVLTRLTLYGALYITLVCLLPEFLILLWQVPFYFGGTSLLIIVVVVMDFVAQSQAHMMSQQYDGLLKKSNMKGAKGGAR